MHIHIGRTQQKLNLSISCGSISVTIGSGCRGNFNVVAYDGSTLHIGDETTSNETRIVLESGCSVDIGRDCMFSNGCQLCVGDMHEIFDVSTLSPINAGN